MRSISATRVALVVLVIAVAACGTLGSEGMGDRDLPSAGVGPFRRLERGEVLGAAPFVLDDRDARYREPAVVPLDVPGHVALFAVATVGDHDVLVRTRATDARSFFGTSGDGANAPVVVLAADAAWEGPNLRGPSVVRRGGTWLLYYAAVGGIGLARSDDGLRFTKEPSPVLVRDPAVAWETTAPTAPGVALFPDGRLHMLYATGDVLGEAESNDGVTWTRIERDPVLGPGAFAAPGELAPGERAPFDTASVSDPDVAVRVTAAGRLHVRVLYTGYATAADGSLTSAIGFAARYGERGPLTRQLGPILAVDKREAAPALYEWGTRSFLYVHMEKTETGAVFPAIAASLSPPKDRLAEPSEYAREP